MSIICEAEEDISYAAQHRAHSKYKIQRTRQETRGFGPAMLAMSCPWPILMHYRTNNRRAR